MPPINTILVDPISPADIDPTGVIANVTEYLGEDSVPRDVRRRRGYNLETMRRLGTPVLLKHMFNADDVEKGYAQKSPYFDDVYGQTRHNDPISHGIGYVSVKESPTEWINPDGEIIVSVSNPGPGYIKAPLYRGFGASYLTYVILPDVAEDMFKLDPTGAIVRIQTARAKMGWFPEVADNDLLILCEVDRGMNVVNTFERYQLKQTTPTSIRGLDKRGRRGQESMDFGNQHRIGQTFELTLIPTNDELYDVETDR